MTGYRPSSFFFFACLWKKHAKKTRSISRHRDFMLGQTTRCFCFFFNLLCARTRYGFGIDLKTTPETEKEESWFDEMVSASEDRGVGGFSILCSTLSL